jgi:hypothetical protein
MSSSRVMIEPIARPDCTCASGEGGPSHKDRITLDAYQRQYINSGATTVVKRAFQISEPDREPLAESFEGAIQASRRNTSNP